MQLRSTVVEHVLRRTLRVVKLRGSGFLAGDHPYTISTRGLTVLHSQTHTKIAKTESLTTRLSTGVERLDRMLDGGFRASTVTLLTGLPGTSKTTLSAEFLWAGCLAGERVLYVGFDEPAEQMIFDCASLGIDLQEFAASDLLRTVSFSAGSAIGDDHFLAIKALVDTHRPTRVVIDPVSALAKSGGAEIADAVTERLAVLFKSRGITAILTAVSNTSYGEGESSTTRVSTVADTWIHLSFAAHRGERNRTLTIIKSRGTAHSNQLRELVLSHEGVTLADVYFSGGDVLFGTARLRREQEATAERVQAEQQSHAELLRLGEEHDAVTRSLEDLQRRLDQIDGHRLSIENQTVLHGNVTLSNAAAVREARFGDPRGMKAAEPK
jgi:circadian clock protein KaiC